MFRRTMLLLLYTPPAGVPVALYAVLQWRESRLAAEPVTGTTNADLGVLARAADGAGLTGLTGIWKGYWGYGPFANGLGEGWVLSPTAWGLCCTTASLLLGLVLVVLLPWWPGVIPHRASLRSWARTTPANALQLNAAQGAATHRILLLWSLVSALCAVCLAVWLVRLGRAGGLELMMPWRVLQASLVLPAVGLLACCLVGARWARRAVCIACDACPACGYPQAEPAPGSAERTCPECGLREAARLGLAAPLRVAFPATAVWLGAPWLLLAGWLGFVVCASSGGGALWVPLDAPRLLQLHGGATLLLHARRLPDPNPPTDPSGQKIIDIRLVLTLRQSSGGEQAVTGTTDRVVRFTGGAAGATTMDFDVSVSSAPGGASGSGRPLDFRVYTRMANANAVYITLDERVTRIDAVRDGDTQSGG